MNIYWGETHDNTYQFGAQDPPMAGALREAANHLDFYTGAYYTPYADAFKPGGHLAEQTGKQDIILERIKPRERLDREWAEFCAAIDAANAPGRFVTFPGYEWQGDARWGDHNVIYRESGLPIPDAMTIDELHTFLRPHKAIAIPHHTGYLTGQRAPDWSKCDDTVSPFMEVYSIHGCSETDEEYLGMRHNAHMGPGVGGSTWQDALDRGLHLGAVASADNWGHLPARHGRGIAAVYATELTREALWDAFINRRVYGCTGDRIELQFTVNDAMMDSIIDSAGARRIRARVVGSDAIDRIELLRNGRVIATHNHQGTWADNGSRYKLRIETGWGPRPNELNQPDYNWHGELSLDGGQFTAYEPCWISPGNQRPTLDGPRATLDMISRRKDVQADRQNAIVYTFDADPGATLHVQLNNMAERFTLEQLLASSHLMRDRDETVALLNLDPNALKRDDPHYHLAHKAKLHRLIPEVGYTATLDYVDNEPLDHEAHYRVRVQQRNGEMAWSSPIWVTP